MRNVVIGLLAAAATLGACGGATGGTGPRDGTSSAVPTAKTAPSGTPLPSGDPNVDYGY